MRIAHALVRNVSAYVLGKLCLEWVAHALVRNVSRVRIREIVPRVGCACVSAQRESRTWEIVPRVGCACVSVRAYDFTHGAGERSRGIPRSAHTFTPAVLLPPYSTPASPRTDIQ